MYQNPSFVSPNEQRSATKRFKGLVVISLQLLFTELLLQHRDELFTNLHRTTLFQRSIRRERSAEDQENRCSNRQQTSNRRASRHESVQRISLNSKTNLSWLILRSENARETSCCVMILTRLLTA